jgi:hypothetical protein
VTAPVDTGTCGDYKHEHGEVKYDEVVLCNPSLSGGQCGSIGR